MPPPEASLTAVRMLLRSCTVALTGGDGEHGSGFFIDDDLVLTCAHVVNAVEGQEVTVHVLGAGERTGVVQDYLPGNELDLALVKVRTQPGDPSQPAAALDRVVQDNISYFATGFPREDLLGTNGLQEVPYTVNAAYEDDNVTPRFLVLHSGGALVQPGMSGGALLSPASGAVVGLVQYTNQTGTPSGGGAIPIVRAATHLAAVKELLERPPSATRAWRDALGREAWLQLGNEWEWHSELNIAISGTVEQWSVRLDSDDGGPYTVTGNGLPDQVARALFHWAQRRRLSDAEDVALMGRLLGGALLPEPLVEQVKQAADSDRLVVRLSFDTDSELFDVPWEYIRISSSNGERQLAADETVRLTRVAPRNDGGTADLSPRRAPEGVLGVVVQPADWQREMPRIITPHKEVKWPVLGQLRERLEESVKLAGRLEPHVLENPFPSEVKGAMSEYSEEHGTAAGVLHYVGFGEMRGGQAKIAFSDGDGDVEWRDLDDLLEWAGAAGTRLMVVQFLLQRTFAEPEPVAPRAFLAALRDNIAAVVFTRFPIHPRQAFRFNLKFYEALAEGNTVEDAVQAGRVDADTNKQLSDAAGFGLFSLLTGPRMGLRLLEPGSSGSRQAHAEVGGTEGARRGDNGWAVATSEEQPDSSSPPRAHGRRDAFSSGARRGP